jgi:hypothetical protein
MDGMATPGTPLPPVVTALDVSSARPLEIAAPEERGKPVHPVAIPERLKRSCSFYPHSRQGEEELTLAVTCHEKIQIEADVQETNPSLMEL